MVRSRAAYGGDIGVSHVKLGGTFLGGPDNEDYSIFGSICWSPYFGTTWDYHIGVRDEGLRV